MILRWIVEGLAIGVRSCVPLALSGLLVWVLSGFSMLLCGLPAIFLAPPLFGGLTLMYVKSARGETRSINTLCACFSGELYWPTMGVFWLSAVINWATSIPTYYLLFIGFSAGVAAIVQWGEIGLLVLAILLPLAFAPAIYVFARLVWAFPLVVDRRIPVAEAFGASWKLTGQILKGFGTFIMLTLLATIAMFASAAVVAITMAVLAGGIGVAVGGTAMEGTRIAEDAPKIDDAPRPDETREQYMSRVSQQTAQEMQRNMEAQTEIAKKAATRLALAIQVTSAVFVVLSSLLAAILGMPVIVGYRDMSPLLPR